MYANKPYTAKAVIAGTVTRPSKPSVKFTALLQATITKTAKGR